jgi:hypothetical protein
VRDYLGTGLGVLAGCLLPTESRSPISEPPRYDESGGGTVADTLPVSADAYVLSGSPNTSLGPLSLLKVGGPAVHRAVLAVSSGAERRWATILWPRRGWN